MTLSDPRPDLHVDHDLWQVTLQSVCEREGGASALSWALNGLRCLGVQIVSQQRGALRLASGEMDGEEFQRACQRYRLPHLLELRAALRDAARRKWLQDPELCRSAA